MLSWVSNDGISGDLPSNRRVEPTALGGGSRADPLCGLDEGDDREFPNLAPPSQTPKDAMNGTLRPTQVARLWMDAMSKPGPTQLKALADVIDDNFSTSSLKSKADALAWFGTWPGKSMFRTGAWGKPSVEGQVVTTTCLFDSKAAYHRGIVRITLGEDGLITHAAIDVRAAPEPLGGVIHRVWGNRAGLERLPEHLARTYRVTAKKVTRLDNGVLRVDRPKGPPWVVRVFPVDRPLVDVKGDAAILRFLEQRDYPAERCVEETSSFEGQGVLITEFVKGTKATDTEATWTKLAGMLGRLHSLTGGLKAVKRNAGGLHLYTAECTLRSEIDTARASLKAGSFRGTDKTWRALREALDKADDFASLPVGLSHPDFHIKNMVSANGALVPIDWAGAGHAPRVLSLGIVLFYGAITPKGWSPKRVNAMAAAYGEHIKPSTSEFDRLAEAMKHRMLIHETYSWCVGMAARRKPGTMKEWPHNNQSCEEIAEHFQGAFG